MKKLLPIAIILAAPAYGQMTYTPPAIDPKPDYTLSTCAGIKSFTLNGPDDFINNNRAKCAIQAIQATAPFKYSLRYCVDTPPGQPEGPRRACTDADEAPKSRMLQYTLAPNQLQVLYDFPFPIASIEWAGTPGMITFTLSK
jgi:hypothetical protein